LRGSSVTNKLLDAGNQNLSSFEAYPINISKDVDNQISWSVTNGTIVAKKTIATVQTVLRSAPYSKTVQKYFRIRENNGTIYWDYATDGATWTNFTSLTSAPFTISSVYLEQMIGTWQSETKTTYALFDNFNIAP